jgi:dihydroflavonol-4-reductase
MKTAGIIGGIEFIGSYITLKFLSEGCQVKVPVSNSPKANVTINIPGLLANENLEICKNNLEEIHQLKEFMQGCNIIVQCGIPVKLG